MENQDYQIVGTIYEDSGTAIYRSKRRSNGESVILKSYRNVESALRLKHEYDILKNRKIDGIANVLDLFYEKNMGWLVLEDTGGIALSSFLEGREFSDLEVVSIGRSLARSLAGIHDYKIIHGDIKPSNILINPDNFDVWYIDFGNSASVWEINASNHSGFQGTLEFVSPERTGRVEAGVDERSDLYSLGVTLYRIAAGVLPFSGKTSMELIHAHIALTPEAPHTLRAMSPVLSHIIMKLLKKQAGKRYQSARSLEFDLDFCINSLESKGMIENFELGSKDLYMDTVLANRLFGKEDEMDRLKKTFDRASAGKAEMVLLTGLHSSGKTMLVNEFEKYVSKHNGFLLHGEFESYSRNEPYYVLREAFERFFNYAVKIGVDLDGLRDALLNEVGENGEALIMLFPFLEEFMGQQPPVIKLSFIENQRRASSVFAGFLKVLASSAHPVVLFIDNVQWADYNSLLLMIDSLLYKSARNLMVIWGIRSDDKVDDDALAKALDALDETNISVNKIDLSYLSDADVRSFLADLLEESQETVSELARYVFEKTGGKPIKITHLLKTLNGQSLLVWNGETESWEWDIHKIWAARIELDLEKDFSQLLTRLEGGSVKFLKFLAACGSELKTEYLVECSGNDYSPEEIKEEMKPLLNEGIITYNSIIDMYTFASVRIYTICYNLMDEKQKRKMHYTIGKKLLEKFYGDKKKLMAYYITAITDHLNKSGSYATSPEEFERLAELNLMSGQKSSDAADKRSAMVFYKKGIEILGDNPFLKAYRTAFGLFENLAYCYYASGDFEEAKKLYEILLANVNNPDDEYTLHFKTLAQCLVMGDYGEVIEGACQYLKNSGLLLDRDASGYEEQIKREKEWFEENLYQRDAHVFLKPEYTDNRDIYRNGSILSLLAKAYDLTRHELKDHYIHKSMNIAFEYGVFPGFESVIEMAAVQRVRLGEYKRGDAIIALAEEYGKAHNTPRANAYLTNAAEVCHWLHPASKIYELCARAKSFAMAEGNPAIAAASELPLLDTYVFTGRNMVKFLKEAEAAADFARKSNQPMLENIFSGAHRQFAKCLLGRTEAPNSFNDRFFDEELFLKRTGDDSSVKVYYFSYKAYALIIHGYFEEALEAFEKIALDVYVIASSIVYLQNLFFQFYAMIRLVNQNPALAHKYMPAVKDILKKYLQLAENCPERYMVRYLLIDAVLDRLEGNGNGVLHKLSEIQLLLHSDANSDYSDFQDYIEGFLQELMFTYWEELQIPQYVLYHKYKAYRIYKNAGFLVKSTMVLQDADLHRSEALGVFNIMGLQDSPSASMSSSTAKGFSLKNMDGEAILNIISLLSGDMDLEAMCAKFLAAIIQVSGANCGYVAVKSGDAVYLEAVSYYQASSDDLAAGLLPIDLSAVSEFQAPVRIIQSVFVKKASITVNSAAENYMFYNDPYIKKKAPQCFCCLPILSKGNPIGVVYLENTELSGVFAEERVSVLNAVNLQISFILHNAVYMNEINEYAKTVEVRLKEHISQLNSLIAGIAHEINSPVGVCVTVISRMQEMTKEVSSAFNAMKLSKSALAEYMDETARGLEIAIGNITRAAELIQNFKKVSVDQSNEVFEEINLKGVLNQIVEYLRPMFKKKVGKVEIKCPDDLAFISCSGVLTQIFTNLIMNAVIHGFEDREKDACLISIKVFEQKENIQIIFSDNGKGMTAEEQEKLFQPFYTTKRSKGGSGLGAHIVLTLITQQLNGSIHCISSPDRGTSFVISLPKNRLPL